MRETIDFGIDLGTTNSAIAVYRDEGAVVVKNSQNVDTTPSVVWMPKPDAVYVGKRAYDKAEDDPDNTAAEFKLEMGMAGRSRSFARARTHMSPPQLSAEVLKALRGDVTNRLGETPASAVITVPAMFAAHQVAATSEAAELAGMTGCPLVQEPTAAAYAYGLADDSERAYWMVFDLGGGTFDAAVVAKSEGELRVLNHAGDPYLGGKLIDWAIVDTLLGPAAASELGFADFTRSNRGWRENFATLKAAAERAKIELSTRDRTEISEVLGTSDGDEEIFEFTLTRAEMERLAEPTWQRAINSCRDALTEGHLEPADVDRVLLVGGPTLAPGLREMIADPRRGLGIALDYTEDPSTVVARGAAIFASTQRLDTPPPPRPAGAVGVTLTYDPTTTARFATVGGRLEGRASWAGHAVTVSNPAGRPPYTSPALLVDPQGGFDVEVPVAEGGTSRFTLALTDAGGTPLPVAPDSFAISHRDIDVPGAVVTQSIGIARADQSYAELLPKGKALPATGSDDFRTTIALHRNADGTVRIPIVEGSNPRAHRNREVGVLDIVGRDLDDDVAAETVVVITLTMDASRRLSASAQVPGTARTIGVEVRLDQVTPPEIDTLEGELAIAERRLGELRIEADVADADVARERLAEIERRNQRTEAAGRVRAASGDVGAAAGADLSLRELQAALDEVEDAIELPQLIEDLREGLEETARLVQAGGGPDHQRELADIGRGAERATASGDREELLKVLDRLRDLSFAVQAQQPDWPYQLFEALRSRDDYVDPDQAAALIERGLRAASVDQLAQVNQGLLALMPRGSAPDVLGGVL